MKILKPKLCESILDDDRLSLKPAMLIIDDNMVPFYITEWHPSRPQGNTQDGRCGQEDQEEYSEWVGIVIIIIILDGYKLWLLDLSYNWCSASITFTANLLALASH